MKERAACTREPSNCAEKEGFLESFLVAERDKGGWSKKRERQTRHRKERRTKRRKE